MAILKTLKEFVPIPNKDGNYKAVVSFSGKKIDVTGAENILNISPVIFGFHLKRRDLDFANYNEVVLDYFKNEVHLTSNRLLFFEKHELPDKSNLFLFKVFDVSLKYIGFLKTTFYLVLLYIKKSGKAELSLKESKHVISFYSIPRNVFLCSLTSQKNQCSIFPVDLVIDKSNEGFVFFSIRRSNINVQRIMKGKKVTFIYSSYKKREDILKLGKYHSKTFPKISELSFSTKRSSAYNNHIPNFLDKYLELECIIKKDIGQQVLFTGRVLHNHSLKSRNTCLAHIHSLFKNQFNENK